jgi:hypothetical protein
MNDEHISLIDKYALVAVKNFNLLVVVSNDNLRLLIHYL